MNRKQKSMPNAGLQKSQNIRGSQMVKCTICGKEVTELESPLHYYNKHNVAPEASKLKALIEERPGLTRGEYANILGWNYFKTQQTVYRMIKRNEFHDVIQGSSKRIYPGPAVETVNGPEQVQIDLPLDVAPAEQLQTLGELMDSEKQAIKGMSDTPKAEREVATTPLSMTPLSTIQVIEAADGAHYAWIDGMLYRVDLIPV